MKSATVKQCPYCKAPFTLDALANNPDIKLIGMSFAEDSIEWAYYFFQHEVPNCGSSFLVRVDEFRSLVHEGIPTERMTFRDCCEEHCVSISDLGNCRNECYFAPFRRLLIRMMEAKDRARTAKSELV